VEKLAAIQNNLSLVALRIRVTLGESAAKTNVATGFLYKSGNETFLITNWHVLTGRHADTGKPLDDTLGLPHTLSISYPMQRHEREKGLAHLWWSESQASLYQDQERKHPVWFEHPVHGGKVDVAAIHFPLSAQEHFAAIAANDQTALGLNSAAVYPTLDVYVLGYPLGLTGGLQLPIYKRATIANEAQFPLDNLPKLFIDTATRKGMSGAPVFVDKLGSWLEEKPDGKRMLQLAGRARRFIGIYSARDGKSTEFDAQLGIVWKPDVIEEVIAGRKAGESSFWPS
jgi:hypothetical protein